MNAQAWKIIGAIEVVALAALAIWAAFSGGCPSPLELANGNTVPMKCVWTFKAVPLVGAVGAVSALLALVAKTKEGRRFSAVAAILAAVAAMLLPTSFGIGICSNPEMHCHATALGVWVLGAIAVVLGVVMATKADPNAVNKPKRGL